MTEVLFIIARFLSISLLLQCIENAANLRTEKLKFKLLNGALAATALGLWQSFYFAPLALFFLGLLIHFHWKRFFNGGSDQMTLITLLGLSIACLPTEADLLKKVGTIFIAIQAVLSYFIAGMVKLQNRSWRTGKALRNILSFSHYRVPHFLRALSQDSNSKDWFFVFTSWALILFEVFFPIFLISEKTRLLVVGLAVIFHLANVLVLGLNRFLWAWLPTYAAIFYWAGKL